MSLLAIVVALVVCGVVLWGINSFIPMDGRVKQILNISVIAILVLWLLKSLGFLTYLSTIHT